MYKLPSTYPALKTTEHMKSSIGRTPVLRSIFSYSTNYRASKYVMNNNMICEI